MRMDRAQPAASARDGNDVIYGLVERGLLEKHCFDRQCMAAFKALPPEGRLIAADELAGMLPRQLRNPSAYFMNIIKKVADRLAVQGELPASESLALTSVLGGPLPATALTCRRTTVSSFWGLSSRRTAAPMREAVLWQRERI